MNAISARTAGISAPIKTTNGALRIPRSRMLDECFDTPAWSLDCTFVANSRDSSIFSSRAILETRSSSSWTDLLAAAFSKDATLSSHESEVKLR